MKTATFLVAAVFASLAYGQTTHPTTRAVDPRVTAFLEASERAKQERLVEMRRQISERQVQLRDIEDRQERRRAADEVRRLKSELAEAERRRAEPAFVNLKKVGSIGVLKDGSFRVVSVFGRNTVLAVWSGVYRVEEFKIYGTTAVRTERMQDYTLDNPHLVVGIDAAGLADGSRLELPSDQVFLVDGTETYTNTLGAATTVLKLRPLFRISELDLETKPEP